MCPWSQQQSDWPFLAKDIINQDDTCQQRNPGYLLNGVIWTNFAIFEMLIEWRGTLYRQKIYELNSFEHDLIWFSDQKNIAA